MSRDDLLGINLKVMEQVGAGIKKYAPERLRHLHHQSARRHGVGAAEILRPAAAEGGRHGRRARLARASAISSPTSSMSRSRTSPPSCSAATATRMVPLTRYSTVAGIPVPDLVKMGWTTQARVDEIVKRTAQRRRRDRQPAQDRLGLLRAGGLRHRDGRELSARQEARAALRRLAQRRIRRQGSLCRRAGGDRRQGRRAHRRDRAQRRRARRCSRNRPSRCRAWSKPARRSRPISATRTSDPADCGPGASHEHPRIPGQSRAARIRRAGAARRAGLLASTRRSRAPRNWAARSGW